MKKNKGYQIALLIGAIFLGSSICRGQIVESQKNIDMIKREVISFLISQNDLEKGRDIKEYDKRIHISELLEEKTLGYSRVGIYRIRVFTSHTKQYLLLKNDVKSQILDTEDFSKTLQSVMNFVVQQKIQNNKAVTYLESIIEIYKSNEHRNPAKLNGD